MTYKNIKFEHSPVMQSLAKLALDKGLVKPNIIEKVAEKKENNSLKPTANLEENILKLCGSLRDAGYSKYAVEVETNFFNLKKAQHIYNTTGETGEDVVNFAHPDGSHKFKNMEGNPTVKTLLDRQKAIQQIVDKQPKGKLGAKALAEIVKNSAKINKNDAINAVKLILASKISKASNMEEVKQLMVNAAKETKSAVELAAKAASLYGPTVNWARGRAKVVGSVPDGEITNNYLEAAQDAIENLRRVLQPNLLSNILPDFLSKGITNEQVYQAVDARLSSALQKVKLAQEKFRELILHPETQNETLNDSVKINIPTQEVSNNKLATELYATANKIISDLNGWKPTINTYSDQADVAEGNKWINSMVAGVQAIINAIDKTPDESLSSVANNLRSKLETYRKQADEFYQTWIA